MNREAELEKRCLSQVENKELTVEGNCWVSVHVLVSLSLMFVQYSIIKSFIYYIYIYIKTHQLLLNSNERESCDFCLLLISFSLELVQQGSCFIWAKKRLSNERTSGSNPMIVLAQCDGRDAGEAVMTSNLWKTKANEASSGCFLEAAPLPPGRSSRSDVRELKEQWETRVGYSQIVQLRVYDRWAEGWHEEFREKTQRRLKEETRREEREKEGEVKVEREE